MNAKKIRKKLAEGKTPALPEVVTKSAVVDIFAAAQEGSGLPPDIENLPLSFFSEGALAYGKMHTDGFTNIETAEQQHVVSREDQIRHNEKVLYDLAALGRLAKAVRVSPEDAGRVGGTNKGAAGLVTMPQSQKALREKLHKSSSTIAKAMLIYDNPKAMETVLANARAGGPMANAQQVLREINSGRPIESKEPKAKSLASRVRDCTKTMTVVNGYMRGLVALWTGVEEGEKEALLKQIRVFQGYWNAICRKHGITEDIRRNASREPPR
jgi:hypothetical protein